MKVISRCGAGFALLACILLTVVEAVRQSDVSRRKGFTKQFVERAVPERRTTNSSEAQFYNNHTARKSFRLWDGLSLTDHSLLCGKHARCSR
jgi:hypothetical protein